MAVHQKLNPKAEIGILDNKISECSFKLIGCRATVWYPLCGRIFVRENMLLYNFKYFEKVETKNETGYNLWNF